MRKLFLLLFLLSFFGQVNARTPETTDSVSLYSPYRFNAKQLIVPGSLLTLGSIGLTHWWKKEINNPIQESLQKHEHGAIRIDNVSMFVPAVAGYAMNLAGFHGKHNVVDATILYATTYILVAATALPLKYAIHSPRPNFKNDHSFPSGHTAIAFAGAELLRKEYWHISPWIGISGYFVATGTAFLRLYNNAHWFNDVLAGAGLGILCAQAAYWLYPAISKGIFKRNFNADVFIAPSVSSKSLGLACSISL